MSILKKILYFGLVLFVFLLPTSVFAATILSCEYHYTDSLLGDARAVVRFEKGLFSNSVKVELKAWHGQNKSEITTLNNASSYSYIFQESAPTCPSSLYVYYYRAPSMSQIFSTFLGQSDEELLEAHPVQDDVHLILHGNSYEAPEEVSEQYYDNVVQFTNDINRRYQEYSLEACKDDSKILTRISECRTLYDSLKSTMDSDENQVNGWLNEGLISRDDERTIAFFDTLSSARERWEEVGFELEREQAIIDEEMNGDTSQGSDDVTSPPLQVGDLDLAKYCTNSNVAMTLRFVGYLIFLAKIFVPVLIIILGSIDFAQAILSAKEDEIKKRIPIFAKRIIAGVIIFFIPTVLDFLFSRVDGYSEAMNRYSNCRTCLLNPNSCNVSG